MSDPGFITEAYLIWVGGEFYPKIEDFSGEAIIQGISKRIPNVHIGRQMMEPGAVVFVAHDEGKTKACKKCAGRYECPDCRKRTEEMHQLRDEIDRMYARFPEYPKGASWELNAPAGKQNYVSNRERRILVLLAESGDCKTCSGEGKVHGGTGGTVELVNGQTWDYRKFNYYLHQPKKFCAEDDVKKKYMCEKCGGTGELPEAQIFGVFIPEKLEYILTGEETEEELALIPDAVKVSADKLKVEAKRRCGKRKPGGFYIATTAAGTTVEAKKTLKDLEARGLVKSVGCELNGSFIRFTKPLKVSEKRFRGVKRIDMSKISNAARMEVTGIMEAME